MRTLILWDDSEQSELLALYLNVDDGVAVVTCESDEFERLLDGDEPFDVVLIPTATPDHETAFARFERIRERRPEWRARSRYR